VQFCGLNSSPPPSPNSHGGRFCFRLGFVYHAGPHYTAHLKDSRVLSGDWRINNIDGTNLPSKRPITQICEDFFAKFCFQDFHDEKPIATELVPQITSGRILSIVDRLRVEAFKSLRLNEPSARAGEPIKSSCT